MALTSNDIAAKFYAQGLSGKWLSAKQAAWLNSVFQAEAAKGKYREMGNLSHKQAFGQIEGVGTWEIKLSPINGAAIFQVSLYSDSSNWYAKQIAEKRESLKNQLAWLDELETDTTGDYPQEYLDKQINRVKGNIARLKQELGIEG